MTFPILNLNQIWWHCGNLKEIDVSDAQINGGLHIGTFLQASDRHKAGRTYHAFTLAQNVKIIKSRDLYMNWKDLSKKSRMKGVQAIAYINRHEGFGKTTVHDDFRGYQIDKMTDREFLKHAPDCTYSLLVLDASILVPVLGQDRKKLLDQEIKMRAVIKRRKSHLQKHNSDEAREMAQFWNNFHAIPSPQNAILEDFIL